MVATTPSTLKTDLSPVFEEHRAHDRRRLLGEQLVEAGHVTTEQLRIAIKEQQKDPESRLGETLVKLGFVGESTLSEYFAGRSGKKFIDIAGTLPDHELLQRIPDSLAKRYRVLPIALEGNILTLAMADVTNVIALDRIRAHLGREVRIECVAAAPDALDVAIDAAYGGSHSLDRIIRELETGEVDMSAVAERGQYAHPIVRLVEALLVEAVKEGASDIHLEPEGRTLRVRMRIDGELRLAHTLHGDYWSPIAVRIKLLSDLNIAESRVPQDGRFEYRIGNRQIDFRVATIPTVEGESITLRILDKSRSILPLSGIGFTPRQAELVKRIMDRPEGVILLTGPTGSGKTTTLYSMLGMFNDPRVKIVTLEDPVEYTLPLLRQTNIHEEIGLDFAAGIRSLLRHDPDIILVGEIRDEATASMAIRAALTGHRVLSTLHANSAPHAFARLVDIGAPVQLLAGAISGVIAQRLVRCLCPRCKTARPASPDEARRLRRPAGKEVVLWERGPGCEHCRHSGYRGRIAIVEVLRVDDVIDELVGKGASPSDIRLAATRNGYRPMVEDGIARVLAGQIDLASLGEQVLVDAPPETSTPEIKPT